MEFISLQGHDMPVLGLGTWKLNGSPCIEAVRMALDIGYRHIDTAQFYENESDVGQALAESGVPREDVFLTTKIMEGNFFDGQAMPSVEESLSKLKTDYVDLLLIHWPFSGMSIREMIEVMQDIRESGKAKRIGISNFSVTQMKEAVAAGGKDIVCNQVEYHPYLSQKAVLEFTRANEIAITAYCPVARQEILDDAAVLEIGSKYNKTPAQVSLRWLIQQEGVAAIPKSGTQKHIRENFEIFDFSLTDNEMETMFGLVHPDGRIVTFGRDDWD